MRECIHPQPGGRGEEEWPRQCDFARLSQLTASDACDVFCFDKDGCHSSKLSASLGFFFGAMH